MDGFDCDVPCFDLARLHHVQRPGIDPDSPLDAVRLQAGGYIVRRGP